MSGYGIPISRFDSHEDNRPKATALHWNEIVDGLKTPSRGGCTIENCIGKLCPHKYVAAWSPVRYPKQSRRKNENVVDVSLLVFDVDHVTTAQVAEIEGKLRRYDRITHATHNDRPDDRCLRVVLRLSRPVLAAEWPHFYPAAVAMLDLPGVDPAAKDLARLYFKPSRPTDADYFFFATRVGITGERLDMINVDAVLARPPAKPAAPAKIATDGVVVPGQRHAALISLAGTMRNKGCDADVVYAALQAFNAKNCNPPKPDAELREIAEYVEGKPAPVPDRAYGRPFLEFVGDEEPDNDPSSVFDVHGLIVRGEPSLIIGEPKVGKTMLLQDLMLHVAAGRTSWCGVPIYRRARVLLFLREDSERTSIRRLWQLARGAGIEHSELAGHLSIETYSPLYFDDDKLSSKLASQLGDVDICSIDSLSTVHNADENSVERMSPVMNRWRDMALQTQTAIPLVHHFRKRGEGNMATHGGPILQRARGSSLIGATTRHAVGIERGPNEHEIVFSVESNHEVDTDPFVLRRVFGTDAGGKAWIRHERIGTVRDALIAAEERQVDPVTLAVIRDVGLDGIGVRDLRAAVIARIKDASVDGRGIRPARVDASARRLEQSGLVEQLISKAWRACPGVRS